jgi:predicted tellurium resistance membrane protein TerC
MSLDNVVAIAAASRGHPELFVFGLLLSIPLIMVGATLITNLISRYPVIVWAGAGLLGYIAAEMIVTDPIVLEWLAASYPQFVLPDPGHPPLDLKPAGTVLYSAAAIGALFVVAVGYFLARNAGRGAAKT